MGGGLVQAIRASAVRKEMEGRAAFEGGAEGQKEGGDDRAVSPGKTELQSLHRDPREKTVGNWQFCLPFSEL